MKEGLSLCLLLFFSFSFAQYRNNTNHEKHLKYISPLYSMGDNNQGIGINVGYYLSPKMGIEISSIYRLFSYKSYEENILEVALQGKYTFIQPKYSSRLFRNFNVQFIGGVAMEMVKVVSTTTLIENYPKYVYALAGGEIEYTINLNFSLFTKFRQFYALNGASDKLGFTRYDMNFGLTYYFE